MVQDRRSDSADVSGSPRTPVAVITMNCAGAVLDLNPAAEALFGWTRAEAVGRRLSELIMPARLRTAHEAGLRRYARTGAAPLLDTPVRLPALRRDGREFPVELVVTSVRHEGEPAFAGFLREVTGPPAADGEQLLRTDLFQTLLEHSPHFVAVLGEDGGITYATPTTTASLGGGERPRAIEDYAHPDDRALVRDAIAQAWAGGLTEPVEFRLRDRTGTWRAVSVVARDLRDHPAVNGIAVYATDTSRARAAERRERVEYTRLMTLVESLKAGVLVQDEQRRVVLTNAAYVEEFADSEAARSGADDVVRRGRPLFGDEVALRGGRVVERDYVPITLDGSTLGHLWVFRDVTTQAEARRALEERNRILTELAALKTEFVAVLSHELRTPLTSIATFAGMLDVADELDPVEYRAAVGAVRRNAERMMSLVEDLVLLARLESRAIPLGTEPVDLAELLRTCAPAGAGDVPDGPPVPGDEALLRELFDTVFGVVAAAGAGAVDLRAAAADGHWTVQVHATTTDPATTERLLSSRLAHPRCPGEHRTGALALTLARAIADRHGGHLATTVAPTEVTVTVTL